MREKILYSWKTIEFEYYDKQLSWYVHLAVVFLTVAFLLIYFLKLYLVAGIVVLGLIALFVHASHQPRKVSCQITNKQIKLGTRKYPFSKLKSYWIYNQGLYPKLYLQTTDLLFGSISIPLGEGDPAEIRKNLKNLLPEDEENELVSDKIGRWFRYWLAPRSFSQRLTSLGRDNGFRYHIKPR